MLYLYHMVPEDMQGTTLMPLNILKEKFPELYQHKASKYDNRKHVMEQIIPPFNCLWNDVIHFSPIPPEDIKNALKEAGFTPREMRYYQIDPSLLDPENTVIYLYAHDKKGDNMKAENFADYDPENLAQYSLLPHETKEYYKEMFDKKERPLLFVRVPHILYKGTLDVSNIPVITI
jgi:hypothetical protein